MQKKKKKEIRIHVKTSEESVAPTSLPPYLSMKYSSLPLADPHKPCTITALAVGKEIYFSTSLRGLRFYVYQKKNRKMASEDVAEEVSLALKRCQVEL